MHQGQRVKDSLGNDVKVKKFRDLQCALIRTFQVKECVIQGDVEMRALYPERTIKKEPIGATSGFEHVSARAIGDVNALSAEQKKDAAVTAGSVPDGYRHGHHVQRRTLRTPSGASWRPTGGILTRLY
jgi:hypothetical protein